MPKTRLIVSGIVMILILLLVQVAVHAGGGHDLGMSFSMTMTAGERDPVEFEGITLGNSMRLTGDTGGIEAVTLLKGSDFYILSPSVKTARKIDNLPPPALDEGGWVEWLVEPGRINPDNFGELIGLDSDFSGEQTAGSDGVIKFNFTGGDLRRIEFPTSRGGAVTYVYSELESDNSVRAADFEIPSDFLVID